VFELGKQRYLERPNDPPTMLSEFLRMREEKEEDAKNLTDQAILEELTTIRGVRFLFWNIATDASCFVEVQSG